MRITGVLPAALLLLACSESQPIEPGAAHDHGDAPRPAFVLTAELSSQLAAARAATARYHRIEAALADGFVDINLFVPGMGWHFINSGRVNATFDPAEPELLVYTREKNGRMRLVAVEYAVPTALTATPPRPSGPPRPRGR